MGPWQSSICLFYTRTACWKRLLSPFHFQKVAHSERNIQNCSFHVRPVLMCLCHATMRENKCFVLFTHKLRPDQWSCLVVVNWTLRKRSKTFSQLVFSVRENSNFHRSRPRQHTWRECPLKRETDSIIYETFAVYSHYSENCHHCVICSHAHVHVCAFMIFAVFVG